MERRALFLSLAVLGVVCGTARSEAAPAGSRAARGGSPARAEENWPQWRGPHGNRVSNAVGLPTTWSLTENIAWKTPLPSWGAGTPIIWEHQATRIRK
jgi:hypothetical protein